MHILRFKLFQLAVLSDSLVEEQKTCSLFFLFAESGDASCVEVPPPTPPCFV